MRIETKLTMAGLAAISIVLGASAEAATASMAKSFRSNTVYASGAQSMGGFTTRYNDFAKGSFSGGRMPQITSIDYTWTPYSNGHTKEKVDICYRPWNGTALINCVDISTKQADNIEAFNNVHFKYGTGFYIRHRLIGGRFPALRPAAGDSITIHYTHGRSRR